MIGSKTVPNFWFGTVLLVRLQKDFCLGELSLIVLPHGWFLSCSVAFVGTKLFLRLLQNLHFGSDAVFYCGKVITAKAGDGQHL